MQGIGHVTLTGLSLGVPLVMPRGKPATPQKPMRPRVPAASAELSWAVEMEKRSLKTLTKQSATIQIMLDALKSIEERVQEMQSEAVGEHGLLSAEAIEEFLAGIQKRLGNPMESPRTQNAESLGNLTGQQGGMEAGQVAFLEELRVRLLYESAASEQTISGVSLSTSHQDGIVPKKEMKTFVDNVQQRLQDLKQAKADLLSYQVRLEQQTQTLHQALSASAGVAEIDNPTLAAEIATLVSTQMTPNSDPFVRMDGAKGGLRWLKMLKDDVSKQGMY